MKKIIKITTIISIFFIITTTHAEQNLKKTLDDNINKYEKKDEQLDIIKQSAFKQSTFIVVPSGVLSKTPIISEHTFSKIAKKNNLEQKNFTESDLNTLDVKFKKVVETLKKENVFEKIKQIAPQYGLSPESVAASIIGEHVFNVTIIDKFQTYFINIYSKWLDKHSSIKPLFLKLLKEKDVAEILSLDISDYEKWDSIMNLYNQKYRGKNDYPDKSFIMTFFNPYGAGLTYGLGQLSPARVLLTNDLAIKYGGLKKINYENTEDLYYATLDVDTNIHYVAASNLAAIITYKKYANFDISNNIGVIATLFNLGAEKRRAQDLAKINVNNSKIQFPVENFYGWYMNKKENEIKQIFK